MNPRTYIVYVLNFWQWSASDLIDNTQRGTLAEYIVALAVGAADDTRRPGWTSCDVKTPMAYDYRVTLRQIEEYAGRAQEICAGKALDDQQETDP